MNALRALTRKDRWHIVPHRFGGYEVIDSQVAGPMRRWGFRQSPLEAWELVKRLAA